MGKKSLLAVAVTAAALAGLSAGPAFAGEVNGSTKNHKEDFAKGKSICMFSGLNDIPEGDPEEGRLAVRSRTGRTWPTSAPSPRSSTRATSATRTSFR